MRPSARLTNTPRPNSGILRPSFNVTVSVMLVGGASAGAASLDSLSADIGPATARAEISAQMQVRNTVGWTGLGGGAEGDRF